MSTWRLRLARYARPHAPALGFVLLLTLVGSALSTLQPWPLKLLVDHVLVGRPLPDGASWLHHLPGGASAAALVGWLAGGTAVMFLANRALHILQRYVQIGIGQRMAKDVGADVFNHLQHLSVRFHGRHRAGDLVRRIRADSGCIRVFTMGVVLPVLGSLVSLAMMSAIMWRLDPFLFLLAILAAPLLGVLIRVLNRPMREHAYRQHELGGEMMALAERTLTAIPVVQAFGREEHEGKRFRNICDRIHDARLKATMSQLQFETGTGAVTALATAALMVVGGLHVLQGTLTVGGLLVFLSYLASLYAPLEGLAFASVGLASAAAGSRRVLEVLEAEERVKDAPGAVALPERGGVRGEVRLEGVSFGYEPGRPVLRDIWLDARPGETVALVGTTGAGKSTLVSLVPRFFDPWAGRVTFDGVDVRELQLKSLRAQVSLVLQEPFLLPLTVAENIAYGRPEAPREEIVAAARAAHAEEFIRRLPQGYDTVIGERGATLSGGQRQRLAIARALLKDAPVLILDEPTAALDSETEAGLLAALERLMRGRTTFLIAHRLSTIRRADRIVVLEAGQIVERGTHEELLAAGGAYHRFHELQFGQSTVGVAAK